MRQNIALYVVRHGQTYWNRARQIQGQIDTHLDDTGRRQAMRNGRRLAQLRSDIAELGFVASPLTRCRHTMEIIRQQIGLNPSDYAIEERLKEIHFGDWQGRCWYDVEAHDPSAAAARRADPYNWRPTGGESYADLTARTAAWLADVASDTVVVSHGGVSRALRGHVLNLAPHEITELRVPQDEILILRHDRIEWL